MNGRLKDLRKTLGLSQEALGNRLGVTKTAISKMELGTYKITDSMVKLICKEFNVDYIWLTTGNGEMFIESDLDTMELIDRIMIGENTFRKNLFKTLAKADDEDMLALERIIDLFLENKNADE